jgi:hypothetical protein
MQLDERPYITVNFAGWAPEDFVAGNTLKDVRQLSHLVPHISLNGHRRTPAFNTVITMGCAISETEDEPVSQDQYPHIGTIFPDEKVASYCRKVLLWPPEEKPAIHIKGIVEYQDLAKKRYLTPFCFLYLSYNKTVVHCPAANPT